jgi:hypothetical protein
VPSIVKNTVTTVVTTYTTKPAWWDAMPTGARAFFDDQIKLNEECAKEVKKDVNGAASTVGKRVWMGAVLVAGWRCWWLCCECGKGCFAREWGFLLLWSMVSFMMLVRLLEAFGCESRDVVPFRRAIESMRRDVVLFMLR